jgi:L-ribulose-5-phosphate 4-epimerase
MNPDKTLQQEAWEANMALFRSGLVIQTFGNVSAFDPGRSAFAIKPSGVPYDQLQPRDMVVVDLDGKRISGKLNPSSDTKTHAVLYKNFNGIGGICHIHSTYATSWAQAMKPIPILGTTHADYLASEIPCTAVMSDKMIQGDYELETGNQILQTFKELSPMDIEMVMVACHGPFTWGQTAMKAVHNSMVLEELAKMAALTFQISPKTKPLKKTLIDKHYLRKHGKDAYYGQE